ncbi:MAG: hypothetical protein JEZ06_16850 [Anaerolineaceae bacterium]|nr:hypothetical protein [Anaerolineaceae bacterium]
MENINKTHKIFYVLITVFIAWWDYQVYRELIINYNEVLQTSERLPYSLLIFLILAIIFNLFLLTVLWYPNILSQFKPNKKIWISIKWIIVILSLITVFYMMLWTSWSVYFSGLFIRLFIYSEIILFSAWLLSRSNEQIIEWKILLAVIIVFGVVHTFTAVIQFTVSYPFRLYWSEGNRFWDYSILYGKDLYVYEGQKPLEITNITLGRQLLWGLPFLFSEVSIQVFRLWNELVFLLPCLILGWAVFKKDEIREKPDWLWVFFGLWVMLFLNQGPIYSPIVISAILVSFSRKRSDWWGFLLVALAGFYAQMSRYTWFAAPAIWAGVNAFLEPAIQAKFQRWKRSIILAAGGLLGGFIIPGLVFPLVGLGQSRFTDIKVLVETGVSGQISRQPLLWERLWPNPTNPNGIVLSLFMAAGPLLIYILYLILKNRWELDRWQKLALIGSLTAFLGVGLVISVKIGGGSNLHNLDMFLIGMVFATTFALEGNLRDGLIASKWPKWPIAILILSAVIFPSFNGTLQARPLALPDSLLIQEYLSNTKELAKDASQNGEVLFIDHRQLLAFQYITDIPLIPEYEKKLLMDKAMSEDAAYFQPFYEDLKSHRFSAIISEPMHTGFKGDEFNFGNENDAWVKWVSIPVLCYYEPDTTYNDIGLQILYPKEPSASEEGVQCP